MMKDDDYDQADHEVYDACFQSSTSFCLLQQEKFRTESEKCNNMVSNL